MSGHKGLKRHLERLEELARNDGGAAGWRLTAREKLEKEQDPGKRAMLDMVVAAPDDEVLAYVVFRERHLRENRHADPDTDPNYFELVERMARRISPQRADRWRVLRDLHLSVLKTEARRSCPESQHAQPFSSFTPREPIERLYAMWAARRAAWGRRSARPGGRGRDAREALREGAEPLTVPEEAERIVQLAAESAEREAGWSASLDEMPGCPCWNCDRREVTAG